jgi:hypothetical protein
MAEETSAPAVADIANTVEEPIASADAIAQPAVAEAKPAEDGAAIATSGVAEGKCRRTPRFVREANATINQSQRPMTLKESPLQRKRAPPMRKQRLKRQVMTQVSQI